MKKITKVCMLMIVIATISTSRLSAQSMISSPTQLNFTTSVGVPVQQYVNVKLLGLSSLGVISNFNATIQGADASHFSVALPQLSLTQLLSLLLGQGIYIIVTYYPTNSNDHTAELIIDSSVLGVLMPVQIIIPLSGKTVPTLRSIDPPLNSAIRVDDPAAEFVITMQFSEDVEISAAGGQLMISPDGKFVGGLSYGSTLSTVEMRAAATSIASASSYFEMLIPADYIFDFDGNNAVYDSTGAESLTLNYTIDPTPYLISQTPEPETIVTLNSAGEISFTYTFNKEIEERGNFNILLSSDKFSLSGYNISGNSLNFTISGNISTDEPLTITIPFGVIVDNSTYILPFEGGSWNYTVSPYVNTRGIDAANEKNVISEIFYTVTGVKVDKHSLIEGTLYIRMLKFDDESTESIKFVKQQ